MSESFDDHQLDHIAESLETRLTTDETAPLLGLTTPSRTDFDEDSDDPEYYQDPKGYAEAKRLSVSLQNSLRGHGVAQSPMMSLNGDKRRKESGLRRSHKLNTKRKPIEYRPEHGTKPAQGNDTAYRSATYNRMKYFAKIAPANQRNALIMPKHAVPKSVYNFGTAPGTQSSIVAILSIWNTMMGTSILAVPWAIAQAGFVLGIMMVICMALLCGYTCSLILRHGENGFLNGEAVEFSDVVRHYLGNVAYKIASVFSILTLWGATIVLWVLMSSFLSNIVGFFHGVGNPQATGEFHSHLWNPTLVPIYLVLVLFPLLNFKDIGFFTKFNSLGVLSIIYMLFFVVYTTAFGENYPGSPFGGVNMDASFDVKLVNSNLFSLSGVMTLSYFIHNGCLSILRNAKTPANNQRDLFIAFILVCSTYLLVGICLYSSYRGDKSCLSDNFLSCPATLPAECPCFRPHAKNYPYVLVAQCFLFVQFVTVLPLLMYLIRFQALTLFFKGNAWPSTWHVLGLNVILCSACVTIAVLQVSIGIILRYCGAICGLIYVFALPMLVDREVLRRKNAYKWRDALRVWTVIALGTANIVGQFFTTATDFNFTDTSFNTTTETPVVT
eukprot:m.65038 g.65038  ORF g.65038 m.65038 type:complete len:611 (+) comp23511_c0_seq1:188-2020(+)